MRKSFTLLSGFALAYSITIVVLPDPATALMLPVERTICCYSSVSFIG